MCKYAGITFRIEPLFPESLTLHRSDLRLVSPHFSLQNQIAECKNGPNADLYTDISITCPVSSTSINVSHTDTIPTAHLVKTYNSKNVKHLPHVGNSDFMPLIFDSYGKSHISVQKLLIALCKKIHEKTGWPLSVLINCWTNRLSYTLHRGEARMLNDRIETSINLSNSIDQSQRASCYDYQDRS